MISQDKTKNLVIEYTSLCIAINKLLDKQTKSWGCFQVHQEADFYSLTIPSLPRFKLFQNQKTIIYRGYWRRDQELPIASDTKSFPPSLWVKKKQKKVAPLKKTEPAKKQRIYEISYNYESSSEMMVVNQLIADFIRAKIVSSIVTVPDNEIFPLVLINRPQ